jgi:methylenetetrahydrofolate reductase (NADPH)
MTRAADGIDEGDKQARRDAWRKEGMQIAVELIKELKEIEGVAGVHVMAIEWESAVQPIVEGAGLLPRPEPEPLPTPGPESAQ